MYKYNKRHPPATFNKLFQAQSMMSIRITRDKLKHGHLQCDSSFKLRYENAEYMFRNSFRNKK